MLTERALSVITDKFDADNLSKIGLSLATAYLIVKVANKASSAQEIDIKLNFTNGFNLFMKE